MRELQHGGRLEALLEALMAARAGFGPVGLKPVLLKIAPDLEQDQERAIAATALAAGIDGLIIGNTTLARPALRSRHREQAGGLSGPALMAVSTAQLARLYRFTEGKLPLVGVGGIACGADAYAKIRAGASALQLYTAFVYQGPGVVRRVLSELDTLLARDGHAGIAAAVGSDA